MKRIAYCMSALIILLALMDRHSVSDEIKIPHEEIKRMADYIICHLRNYFCATLSPKDKKRAEEFFIILSTASIARTTFSYSIEEKNAYFDIYSHLLKRSLADSMRPGADVLDGWACEMLLYAAPPEKVLDIIVPEMNPGGLLQNVISRIGPLKEYLQHSSGNPFSPSFVHYRKFLFPGKSPEKVAGLLSHMYRTDPYQTIDVLQSTYMVKYGTDDKTRELLWLTYATRLVVFSRNRNMDCPSELEKKVREQLNHFLKSEYWFERAFAVVVLERNRELLNPKFQPILGRMVRSYPQDPHIVVRVLGRDLYRERLQKQKRQK